MLSQPDLHNGVSDMNKIAALYQTMLIFEDIESLDAYIESRNLSSPMMLLKKWNSD